MTEIVIFDTEYTTWDGARDRGWMGDNEYRELVQLGALKVDWPSGNVIDSLDILVKPVRNPKLSAFFTELTGITQDVVDRSGIAFDDALKIFFDFCGVDTPTLCYGNDFCILAENVALHHAHPGNLYGWGAPEFMNCSFAFERADPAIKEKKVTSGSLWAHFGLPKPADGDGHNALFDCYSILAGLKHLKHRKMLGL
jgi:hypothetical protein